MICQMFPAQSRRSICFTDCMESLRAGKCPRRLVPKVFFLAVMLELVILEHLSAGVARA